jgi:hypothetical protein
MNKTQVGNLLKVIPKDGHTSLEVVYIDTTEDHYSLVATNGHVLVSFTIDNRVIRGMEELVGKQIRRRYIERWYKLADRKSVLDSDALIELYNLQHVDGQDVTTNFPDYKRFLPRQDRIQSLTGEVGFNANYMKLCQDIEGADYMRWNIGQPLEPIFSYTERGKYVVMPIKL